MFIDTTDTIIKSVMNTEHFTRILKNYSQQLSLFLYIQFFGLIALTPLEPSTSLTGALCSSNKHLRSTSVQPLSLAHCIAHTLPHFSPQDSNTRLLFRRYHSLIATRLSPVMPSAVLYKAYCMPVNFYVALDNPSRTFTLSQLLMWIRLL